MPVPSRVPPLVSIVVPVRNEARNLEALLPRIPAVHEVLLVDGGSVDGSICVAEALVPGVRVIPQAGTGKGNALACGFAAATGDVIVLLDADGSADPREIPRFVGALEEGADVVRGSRFVLGGGSENAGRLPVMGAYFVNRLANALLGSAFTDLAYPFTAFWRRHLPDLELEVPDRPAGVDARGAWGDGLEIDTILTCRFFLAGRTMVEVASLEGRRSDHRAAVHAAVDGFRILRAVATERRRPARPGRPGRFPDARDDRRYEDAS